MGQTTNLNWWTPDFWTINRTPADPTNSPGSRFKRSSASARASTSRHLSPALPRYLFADEDYIYLATESADISILHEVI